MTCIGLKYIKKSEFIKWANKIQFFTLCPQKGSFKEIIQSPKEKEKREKKIKNEEILSSCRSKCYFKRVFDLVGPFTKRIFS